MSLYVVILLYIVSAKLTKSIHHNQGLELIQEALLRIEEMVTFGKVCQL